MEIVSRPDFLRLSAPTIPEKNWRASQKATTRPKQMYLMPRLIVAKKQTWWRTHTLCLMTTQAHERPRRDPNLDQ